MTKINGETHIIGFFGATYKKGKLPFASFEGAVCPISGNCAEESNGFSERVNAFKYLAAPVGNQWGTRSSTCAFYSDVGSETST